VNAAVSALAEAPLMAAPVPALKWLGRVDYENTWRAMQRFTDERNPATADEVWLLEHDPVFTLGMNADRTHVLAPKDIPVIQIDRGGEVTYHGPGQLVVYPLIDVRRAGLGVRDLVTALERTVVAYLAGVGVSGECRPKAPGVYVTGRKIASVGLRIRRHGSYHGLAFNVRMDLEPFERINPCGYPGLEMTQLCQFRSDANVADVAAEFGPLFVAILDQVRQARARAKE
jgi:lipoyl(octanoyl) transferase